MELHKYICNGAKVALLSLACILAPLSGTAQNRTGYFLDGNSYRHYLNPALTPEKSYFSFPMLGNFNINTRGTMGYKDFIYPLEGNAKYKQTTFMSPTVSNSQFMSNIESNNNLMMNLDITILSVGFKGFGGFNTLDLNLRSHTGVNLPGEFFRFIKTMSSEDYVIKDLNARTINYAELALGHSRKILDELTVGAKVKFLFGLAYSDVNFDRIEANLNGNQWLLNARGNAKIAIGGKFTHDNDGKIDGYDDITAGMQGFGMGLDLGAVYDLSEILTPGLSVSASITDLGYIGWSKTAKASIRPDDPYTFAGFTNLGIHGDDNPIDDQFEDLKDDLEDFFELKDDGEGSEATGIGTTVNLGAEYKMPFYDKLKAGLLFTHRFDGVYSYTETTLSANVCPTKWFDLGVSAGVGTYGFNTGAMMNIAAGPLNLFLASDVLFVKTTKQFIPLEDTNFSASFGINFRL